MEVGAKAAPAAREGSSQAAQAPAQATHWPEEQAQQGTQGVEQPARRLI
jgi:hypothetical protein